MEEEFVGSFYFDITSNGNLVGEFSNNKSIIIQTESANVINKKGKPFEGTFISTWFDSKLNRAKLTVEVFGCKFKLTWTETNNQDYYGEGFLKGNILIGYYKKVVHVRPETNNLD